jgi:cytidylate kinase
MGCHREKRSDEAIPMGLEQPLLPPVILITGPTASGKSALALDLARYFSGVIINADAIQVYRDLPILSAQPNWMRDRTGSTAFLTRQTAVL